MENGHWLKPQRFLLGLGFRNKLCHPVIPIYFEINLELRFCVVTLYDHLISVSFRFFTYKMMELDS